MASRSWNRIELIGNLTRDPELRFIPSGTAVATFGLATYRVYVSDGEKKEDVDFHKLVAWGKLAELANQLLKKGTRVFVSGRLQYREWETQEGQKRRDAEIVIEDLIVLTPKNGAALEEFLPSTEPAEESSPASEESGAGEVEQEIAEDEEKPKSKTQAKVDETVNPSEDLPF